MTLIPLTPKETAPAQAQPTLEGYEKNLGMIPNLFRLLAHSPDDLKAVAEVAKSRGHVDAVDIDAVRAAGYTDAQIIAIVPELAFRFTTNLFDNTFKTDFDTGFPVRPTHYKEPEAAVRSVRQKGHQAHSQREIRGR